jgi:hypothetical protein
MIDKAQIGHNASAFGRIATKTLVAWLVERACGAMIQAPEFKPLTAGRRAGVWAIMSALAEAHDAAVQMIDTSIVRVHQHGACMTRNRRQSIGREVD